MFVEVEQRIVPATAEQLAKFSRKTLEQYAAWMKVESRGLTKQQLAEKLVATGGATLCATVGT